MFLRRFLRTAFVAGIAASMSAAACSGKKNTELVIAIQTDLRIPKDLNGVTLEVNDQNGNNVTSLAFAVGPDGLHLPATIGVVAKNPTDIIDVKVTGQFGDTTDDADKNGHVVRHERFSFVEGRTGLVRMPLRFSCYDVKCEHDGEACVAGVCKVVSTIDSATLPEFSAEQVYGPGANVEGNGGKCWDPLTCFKTDIDLGAPNPGENGECFFPLPDHMPKDTLNVFMVVRNHGFCDASGTCRVVLDRDQAEGWHFDETQTKVVLPIGLCTKLASPGTRLEGGLACETKTVNLPLCDVDSKATVGSGPMSDAGSDGSIDIDSGPMPADGGDLDGGATDGSTSVDSGIDVCGLGPTTAPPTSEPLLAGYQFLSGSVTANMTGGPPLTFVDPVSPASSGMSCPISTVNFTGTQYATANVAALDKAGSFTVSAWVRNGGTLPANATIVSTAATSAGIELGTDASSVLTGTAQIGSTLYTVKATGFTVTDGWHQVVLQWQGSAQPLRLFIDGALRGSTAVTDATAFFLAATNVSIGRRSFAPAGKYWVGELGDIRFYGK